MPPTILWFRQDLRLQGNPAFLHAIEQDVPLIPIYIFSSDEEKQWKLGGASCWWLHHSLIALNAKLKEKGGRLYIFKAAASDVIGKLVKETGAGQVVFNHRYEPAAMAQEKQVQEVLKKLSCTVAAFHGNLLFEPGSILTAEGKPYQVFTPFYHTCCKHEIASVPVKRNFPISWTKIKLKSLSIEDLDLLPDLNWDDGFYKEWTPGEESALAQLRKFARGSLNHYSKERDFPANLGTSRLSAHLHFGEISPAQIWLALEKQPHAEPYLRQLIWREFAHHLLVFFPHTHNKPLKEKFLNFPWKKDARKLKAWQKGMTGYPIVDAGMRQLWKTGWMHNRLRMIVASFLVKDLMIPWQEGAKWFWDTLVDADLANNTLGWQWCAGCGADAAPFFRIFNPWTQSKKFDPEGEYIRTYVPELKELPNRWIHAPHLAPKEVLKKASIVLGETYPEPIIDHDKARKEALHHYYLVN